MSTTTPMLLRSPIPTGRRKQLPRRSRPQHLRRVLDLGLRHHLALVWLLPGLSVWVPLPFCHHRFLRRLRRKRHLLRTRRRLNRRNRFLPASLRRRRHKLHRAQDPLALPQPLVGLLPRRRRQQDRRLRPPQLTSSRLRARCHLTQNPLPQRAHPPDRRQTKLTGLQDRPCQERMVSRCRPCPA